MKDPKGGPYEFIEFEKGFRITAENYSYVCFKKDDASHDDMILRWNALNAAWRYGRASDKWAGDGPYIYSGDKFYGPNGFTFKVEWDYGFKLDSVALTKEIIKVANIAYSEGRKSMEKDFKELLELANNLADVAADDVTPFPEIRKFDAWKKARGIK